MRAVFKDFFNYFLCVVDFADRRYRKGAVVRADKDGLRLKVGNAADAELALKLVQLMLKLCAKRAFLYAVYGFTELPVTVNRHTRAARTEVRMIVNAEKKIERAAFLRSNSEKTTH